MQTKEDLFICNPTEKICMSAGSCISSEGNKVELDYKLTKNNLSSIVQVSC